MKAYVYGAGGPAVADVAKPSPKGTQVLVKVHACGLNRADLGMARIDGCQVDVRVHPLPEGEHPAQRQEPAEERPRDRRLFEAGLDGLAQAQGEGFPSRRILVLGVNEYRHEIPLPSKMLPAGGNEPFPERFHGATDDFCCGLAAERRTRELGRRAGVLHGWRRRGLHVSIRRRGP